MRMRTISVGFVLLTLAATCSLAADVATSPASQSAPAPKRKPRGTSPGKPPVVVIDARSSHTTIAPFPMPGDTSHASAERMKLMNVPKSGITTIAPMPPPGTGAGSWSGGVIPPQQMEMVPEATRSVPPFYPDAARNAGIQGTVLVGARVGVDGGVDSVRVIRSVAGLDSTAMASVRKWHFNPASLHGKPIPAWVAIPVRFTLH